MNPVFVSIVIPTRNRGRSVVRLLDLLHKELRGEPLFSVHIIDDASDPSHASQVKGACDRLHVDYVRLPGSRGPAHARNIGIARGTGEWVAFLDDDVLIGRGWRAALLHACKAVSADTAGIEGAVAPLGNGVWDAEVANKNGGLYLTANCVYRRSILNRAGGFDDRFRGPFAEDIDLALRVKRWGDIPFRPEIRVWHSPRAIDSLRYIRSARARMRLLLESEHLLYRKHPARYHTIRHARTFWGTLAALCGKNVWITLRRRGFRRLAGHPVQTIVCALASVLEQFAALTAAPGYLRTWRSATAAFDNCLRDIDVAATTTLLGASPAYARVVAQPNLWRSLTHRVARRPVYDIRPALHRNSAAGPHAGVYVRIDDVFLDNSGMVYDMLATLQSHGMPFCAAIPLEHLRDPSHTALIHAIVKANGVIGVHGIRHRGRYGPYASEILQLSHGRLTGMARDAVNTCGRPAAFIPPFNAIDWPQIVHLGKYFPVICGGPETMRFAGRIAAPVRLKHGAVYFPSLYPLYNTAARILEMRGLLDTCTSPACITLHMHAEANNRFVALSRLGKAAGQRLRSWSALEMDV